MTAGTLLLFDIDGTLLTCRGRGLRAMHRAVQGLFGLAPVAADIRPHGKTDPMLFDELASAYALAPEAMAARRADLVAAYVRELEGELGEPGACTPKPGVPSLLSSLGQRPEVLLGLVSGNLEPAAWSKLGAAGLAAGFRAGAFGSDGRRRADLVALALARFGYPAAQAWVIGDTPDDVAAGRAHGTRTLAVATGGFSRDQLAVAGPDALFDDFTDTEAVVRTLCDRS
jgi:phosphoglycolate phosphatase-like HAD superfamily hydrolase